MNDKALLELAAKAVGIVGEYYCDENREGIYATDENDCGYGWNPLLDDGDALRLAVKLNMDLMLSPNHGKWARIANTDANESGYPETDPCASTRRAIVRAAAEVGLRAEDAA